METDELELQRARLNAISKIIVSSAIEVHRHMGPGLLESIYQHCLIAELRFNKLHVEQRVPVSLYYKSMLLDKKFEIDLLIEREIILELKTVDYIDALFEAQLLSYLRLTDKRLGFIINFHVPLMKDGFKRMVNNF
ncbi:MAG: GxxExxY protein [Chryseolinea sp.]